MIYIYISSGYNLDIYLFIYIYIYMDIIWIYIYLFIYIYIYIYIWGCKTPLIQRRSDYFLISDQLQGQIEAIDIIPSVQSDHSTVRIRVNETQYSTKGRSYWKFNSFTHDDAFVQALRNEIPKFYSESS